MAGIDNNTLLYLRGDSFKDLSLSPKSIENTNTNVQEGFFGKYIDFNSNSYVKLPVEVFKSILNNQEFTIEYYYYENNQNFQRKYTISSWGNNKYSFMIGTAINEKTFYFNYRTMSSPTAQKPTLFASTKYEDGKWYHIAITKENQSISIFVNGKKESTLAVNETINTNIDNVFVNRKEDSESSYNFKLCNIRISNIARYTEDFTPPTKPYNSITINKTNQTDTNIEFNIEKLGQETINKVEVLVNGIVSETYTDSYNNINYLIDKDLCSIGANKITIRVTYDDLYTEELLLTHTYTVDELPLETPLIDTVERVKLLTKSKQNEKTMLSSILTSKNVEVSEEDKMSDLISKVDLLGEYDDSILYLYKNGDECVSVTGEWSTLGGLNSKVTMYKNSNNITIYNTGVGTTDIHGGICTNLSIDISSYSKVKAEVETVGSDCAFYIITSRNLSSSEYPAFVNFGPTTGEISIDTSKVYRNVYFYIRPNQLNQPLVIKKIWLEK